jgi:hypothetical protein
MFIRIHLLFDKKLKTVAAIFWFFSVVSLFCCSGRIGNIDAHYQLLASLVFVKTGQVGSVIPPGGFEENQSLTPDGRPMPKFFFWQAPNGLYYQTHDIGNPLLMLPIAAIWHWGYSASTDNESTEVPPPIKALTSAYFSMLSAITATVLFACLRLSMREKGAFAFSLLFLVTSFYLTYTRMPWDVAGAGMFAAIALYFSLKEIKDIGDPLLRAVGLGVAIGFATNFRFSFGPFLLVSLILALSPFARKITAVQIATFGIALLLTVLPSFIYNYVRTGNALHPATVIPRYPTKPEFTLAAFDHFWRMFFSLNKGLFIFSPVLAFAFIARTKSDRWLMLSVMIGLVGYAGGLALTRAWSGGPSWGQRYLVPMLPLLYYLAAVQISQLVMPWKLIAYAALAFGFLVNLPTYCTNYQIAINEYEPANNDFLNYPHPQIAAWRGLIAGLAGDEIAISDRTREAIATGKASASTAFPDLLVAHIARRASVGGLMMIVGLAVIGLFSFNQLRFANSSTHGTTV